MKRFIKFLSGLLIMFGILFISAAPGFADGGGIVIKKPEFKITADVSPDKENIFRIKKAYEGTNVDTRDADFKERAVSFDYELKALSTEAMAQQKTSPETVFKGHAEIPAGSDYVDIDPGKLIDTKKIKSDIGFTVFLVIDDNSLKGANGAINSNDPVPLFSGKMAEYMEQAQKIAGNLQANGKADTGSILGGVTGKAADAADAAANGAAGGSGKADPAAVLNAFKAAGNKNPMSFFKIDYKFIINAVLIVFAVIILGGFAISAIKQKRV